MSQTQTMGKQGTTCKESAAAAAALIDVASGFPNKKKKASDSSSSSTSPTSKALPTNSASRKLWDSEQAAPSTDHGIAGRFPPPSLDISTHQQQHGFTLSAPNNNNNSTALGPASLAAAAVAGGGHWPAESASATRLPIDPAGFHCSKSHTTTTTTTTTQRKSNSNSQQMPAAVNMSMSSIGFGVDPSCSPDGDATEAAYRAVRDAMERSAVCMPTSVPHRQNLSIHVKLGVPAKPSSGDPMRVDVERLEPLLPRSVPLQPVELTVGGLLIDHKEMEAARHSESVDHHPTVCTAVACVTLQQITTASEAEAVTSRQSQGVPADGSAAFSHLAPSPWAHLEQPAHHHPTTSNAAMAMPPAQRRTMSTSSAPAAAAHTSTNRGDPLPSQVSVHRSNSMEVLAMISGEIRERHLNSQKTGKFAGVGVATPAFEAGSGGEPTAVIMNLGDHESRSQTSDNSRDLANNAAYSYKKLAPGMTPKNNKRLFVKHSYRDYSREDPLPEEQYLVRSQDSPTRTPNAAFPLKLHETLTQIEQDGYGHIIGWQPHGRAFKIFQQQDFVNIVLPKYFVMTKKSSFLRQLNLYGFNRISVGPDVGSYYHEKFLKGLKFLCRRMARMKVNGNGIRAAGNPDDEPHLSRFPVCPPSAHGGGTASCNSSVTHTEHTENDSHDNRSHSQTVQDTAVLPGGIMVTDENSHASHGSGTAPDSAALSPGGQPKQQRSSTSSGTGGAGGSSSGQVSFPLKLQRLLDKMEAEGNTDIISWLPHGRAFLVHDVEKFVSDIMTQYFNQTKYSSFQRQLHMYNFQRITFGRDKGAYHHPSFQRGRPNLCLSMVRTRVNGKGCRRPGDPDAEPSFYEQEYLPPIPKGTIVEIPTDVSGVGSYDEDADVKGQTGDDVGQTSEV